MKNDVKCIQICNNIMQFKRVEWTCMRRRFISLQPHLSVIQHALSNDQGMLLTYWGMGKKQDDSFSSKREIHLLNYFTVMKITDVDKIKLISDKIVEQNVN